MKKLLLLCVVGLSTSWILGQQTQNERAPMPLPFIEHFDDESSMANWTVNASCSFNENAYQVDGSFGGALQVVSKKNHEQDAYFATNPIIIPAAGNYHLSFFTVNITPLAPKGNHSFKILYGLSSHPEEMSLLADYPDFYYGVNYEEGSNFNDYLQSIINFEITTPGNYYFAFYDNTDSEIAALFFDDIEIDNGILEVTPDISLKKIFIPLGGCASSPGNVGAMAWNRGNKPITEFTLSYQIGDEPTVSQTFVKNIGVREKVEVFFDPLFDFSSFSNKSIKFSLTTPDDDYLENNERTLSLANFEPVTKLPFESNFLQTNSIKNWYPLEENTWEASNGIYWAYKKDKPLLSRCVSLEPDLYRFSYSYIAGWFGQGTFGVRYFPNFYVTYGKSGTDPSTWEPVKEYSNIFTLYELAEDSFLVNITEPGEYVFAFFPLFISDNYVFNFGVHQTSLSKIPEHSFCIKEVDYARIVPKNQMVGTYKFTATVENRGKTPNESGTIQLLYNNKVMASEDFAFTKVGETINIDFKPVFESLSVENISLKFNASNQNGVNNSVEITMQISDSTFAYDKIDKNFFADLPHIESDEVGMIFELQKKALLTSVNIGFLELASPMWFNLAVYQVNDNLVLGEKIFSGQFSTHGGSNAKAITFDVPDIELLPGKYFFEINNLTDINHVVSIGVAIDFKPKGHYYNNIDGRLQMNHYHGSIHLRPNFGKSSLDISQYKTSENQLTLYPNPVTSTLNIETGDSNLLPDVKIYAIQGALLIHTKGNKIDVSSLPSGFYMVNINGRTVKVVKQ